MFTRYTYTLALYLAWNYYRDYFIYNRCVLFQKDGAHHRRRDLRIQEFQEGLR